MHYAQKDNMECIDYIPPKEVAKNTDMKFVVKAYGKDKIRGKQTLVSFDQIEDLADAKNGGRKFELDEVHCDNLKSHIKNVGWDVNAELPILLKLHKDRYRILAGNHRIKALQALGCTEFLFGVYEQGQLTDEDILDVQMRTNNHPPAKPAEQKDYLFKLTKYLDSHPNFPRDRVEIMKLIKGWNRSAKERGKIYEAWRNNQGGKVANDWDSYHGKTTPDHWVKTHAEGEYKDLKWGELHTNGKVYTSVDTNQDFRSMKTPIQKALEYPNAVVELVAGMRDNLSETYKTERNNFVKKMEAQRELIKEAVRTGAIDRIKFGLFFPQAEETKSKLVN